MLYHLRYVQCIFSTRAPSGNTHLSASGVLCWISLNSTECFGNGPWSIDEFAEIKEATPVHWCNGVIGVAVLSFVQLALDLVWLGWVVYLVRSAGDVVDSLHHLRGGMKGQIKGGKAGIGGKGSKGAKGGVEGAGSVNGDPAAIHHSNNPGSPSFIARSSDSDTPSPTDLTLPARTNSASPSTVHHGDNEIEGEGNDPPTHAQKILAALHTPVPLILLKLAVYRTEQETMRLERIATRNRSRSGRSLREEREGREGAEGRDGREIREGRGVMDGMNGRGGRGRVSGEGVGRGGGAVMQNYAHDSGSAERGWEGEANHLGPRSEGASVRGPGSGSWTGTGYGSGIGTGTGTGTASGADRRYGPREAEVDIPDGPDIDGEVPPPYGVERGPSFAYGHVGRTGQEGLRGQRGQGPVGGDGQRIPSQDMRQINTIHPSHPSLSPVSNHYSPSHAHPNSPVSHSSFSPSSYHSPTSPPPSLTTPLPLHLSSASPYSGQSPVSTNEGQRIRRDYRDHYQDGHTHGHVDSGSRISRRSNPNTNSNASGANADPDAGAHADADTDVVWVPVSRDGRIVGPPSPRAGVSMSMSMSTSPTVGRGDWGGYGAFGPTHTHGREHEHGPGQRPET